MFKDVESRPHEIWPQEETGVLVSSWDKVKAKEAQVRCWDAVMMMLYR